MIEEERRIIIVSKTCHGFQNFLDGSLQLQLLWKTGITINGSQIYLRILFNLP